MGDRPRVSFPTLDSLRALCFLSVFLAHSFSTENVAMHHDRTWGAVKYGLFGNGGIGVNVFFVLSGFLITYLLIVERAHEGRLDVPRFWLRRALRIWPLYYACLLFAFLIFPWLKMKLGEVPHETADPVLYSLFMGNFDLLWHGPPDASMLGVLWSIAVEEQFYLFWPLIMAITPPRWFWAVFAAILVQSWIFRMLYPGQTIPDVHTLSCIGDMAIGAGAALLASIPRYVEWIERWNKGTVVLLHLSFLAIYFFRSELLLWSPVTRVFERSAIALLAAGIILYQTHGKGGFWKLPSKGLLSAMGRISYGLYCLHMLGMIIAIQALKHLALDGELWQVLTLQPILALLVTTLMAVVSYRTLEQPFLRLKKRFSFVSRS